MYRRKISLRLLDLTLQLLHCSGIILYIFLVLLLEDFHKVLSESLIEVLSSQVSISRGCNHFENTVIDSEKGYIEGSSSQIKHDDVLLSRFFVHSVGNGSCSRLVDDSQHI
mmetsp:Transcript_9345/g.8801  ORF Transcript_9345/g.8801 Transcript_9345/m.8801 type:complete len:111 (-) Transcript_9345:486-818(-)